MDAAELDPGHLDAALAGLPPEWAVAQSGRDRLVAGPSGAFVLRPCSGQVHRDARRVVQLARTTRAGLADHLAWVPVIDALLVTGCPVEDPAEATIIPVDLVTTVLLDGVQRLDEDTLRKLTGLLVERRLVPEWVPAAPVLGEMLTDTTD